MTRDDFHSLETLEPPPADWDDVLTRAQAPTECVAGDLPVWRQARVRILVAAAAVLLLVTAGVAAFAVDGDDDTVIADRPPRDRQSTTSTTDPPVTATPGTGTTPPPTSPPPPPTETTPPPTSTTTSPPVPETTPPPPEALYPIPAAPPPLSVGDTIAPNGTCALQIPSDLATVRPGISPVWSLASSLVFNDGSVYAQDRSWPPYAIIHGEVPTAGGVTFEIGIGIGARTPAWDPDFDLGANLVPASSSAGLGTTGDRAAWPGTGAIHDAALRRGVTRLTGNLIIPPPGGHITRIGVATSSRSHPNPNCNHVYVAMTAPTGAQTPAAIDGLIRQLFQGMQPG